MDEAALIEEVAEILESEPEREFFTRRAMDKSCYEVVHDLDPDGPITDSSFKVVATFSTSQEAAHHALGLSYDATAQRLLPILRRIHNEAVEKAAKVADELGGDRIARNADGSLRSYDMESKHGRGDAMLNGMRVRAQTIATAIRQLKEPEQ